MRLNLQHWSLLSLLLLLISTSAAAATRFAPVEALLEGATPQTQGLTLELPLVADNGASVDLSLRFDAALAEGDQLEFITLFATENPRADILRASFLDARVEPQLSTRIRLNQSQTVIAVARSQQGQFWIAEQQVRVTVSGCLIGGDETQITSMQQPRIALPRRLQAGRSIDIRTLINHPMETGLTQVIGEPLRAQNLIESFTLELDQQPALHLELHTGVAANPYFRFGLILPASTQASFIWQDQQGEILREERQLQL
ncbi:thiosulfate oxidation carrier protein SoxY [Marinospirillum sp. MEB164]|uniref:Thiosulfate oxidation carrier protein SoxY n=1 Tax=Marinospirillum alkalitolerans TaxID=3123374 RepID=A0ABW8PY05_9GAMM